MYSHSIPRLVKSINETCIPIAAASPGIFMLVLVGDPSSLFSTQVLVAKMIINIRYMRSHLVSNII